MDRFVLSANRNILSLVLHVIRFDDMWHNARKQTLEDQPILYYNTNKIKNVFVTLTVLNNDLKYDLNINWYRLDTAFMPKTSLEMGVIAFIAFRFCNKPRFLISMPSFDCDIWLCIFLYLSSVSRSVNRINPTKSIFEPPHDRTNKMICAPSEDTDQPGHPPKLIHNILCALTG